MEISQFHFHSFGKVAANKPRGSNYAEVAAVETFSMMAGELTDNVETIDTGGQDSLGKNYVGKVTTKPTLTCRWLPMSNSNRVTPPDVRRNEEVLIYRFADTEYYFWTTLSNNTIRKLETMALWFSGTPVEGEGEDKTRTADNGYFFELSTHEKHVIFSTSDKNGEVCRYYLQFDMNSGNFTVKDNLGQEVEFDSPGGKINVKSENEVNVTTKKHTTNCEEHVINTKKSTINTETFEVNASASVKFNTPIVEMSKDLKVSGASLFLKLANFTTGIGGGGSGDTTASLSFKGNVDQIGTWNTRGAFAIIGNLNVTGTGAFSGNVSAPNIR